MASLIHELIDVLNEEAKIYEEYLPISQAKTQIIVENNLEKLIEFTDKENLFVDQMKVIENKRESIFENIAIVINKDKSKLKIKDIIDSMDENKEETIELTKIHKRLSDVMYEIQRLNHHNAQLIEQSLELIEFNLNIITNANNMPQGHNYTKNAYIDDEIKDPRITTKRTFDVKR